MVKKVAQEPVSNDSTGVFFAFYLDICKWGFTDLEAGNSGIDRTR